MRFLEKVLTLMNRDEFLTYLDSEIKSIALSAGVSNQSGLAEYACKLLEESNEVTSMELGSANMVIGPTRKKFRIDAFGFDEIDGTLFLLASDASERSADSTFTRTEADTLFGQLSWFVDVSLNDKLRSEIPTYEQAAQFSWTLSEIWPIVHKVKLIVVTNRTMSERIRSYEVSEIAGKSTQAQIWDESRIHGLLESKTGKEATEVVLAEFGTQSLPMLSAETHFEGTNTFLAVIPGVTLARIFDKFGSRLLEGNVRGFLSVRGKINKGIRSTILGQPERFLAFNNGITATATAVQVDEGGSLLSIENLQIVNGGQTTASLFNMLKNEKGAFENLERTSVAMKLIVVDPQLADELVPDIARFSNSQNKVTEIDFFANSPFHRRMEEISKRLLAPATGGNQISTKWFYERARGSFENERSRESSSLVALRRFDDTHPRHQKIDKGDLARFHSIINLKPYFARRGVVKNFQAFSNEVSPKWDTEEGKALFGDSYYKKIACTKMIYDSTHKAVRGSDWYTQGYLADIVTFGISKVIQMVEDKKLSIPWDAVWQKQSIPPQLLRAFTNGAELALESLLDPRRRQQNVTEWAKSEDSWSSLKARPLELSDDLLEILPSREDAMGALREDRDKSKILSEFETLKYLEGIDRDYWNLLESHPRIRISPTALGALKVVMSGSALLLDRRKAAALVALVSEARDEGVPPPSLG
jgi:hypothetical protein